MKRKGFEGKMGGADQNAEETIVTRGNEGEARRWKEGMSSHCTDWMHFLLQKPNVGR